MNAGAEMKTWQERKWMPRNRFHLIPISLVFFSCVASLEPLDKAAIFYPGPELPLDQVSILFHETCLGATPLGEKNELTHIDGQRIKRCSPIALLPGKHDLQLQYVREVSKVPFEFKGRISYSETVTQNVIFSCQFSPGQKYRIIISATINAATGFCASTGEEVKGQYHPD